MTVSDKPDEPKRTNHWDRVSLTGYLGAGCLAVLAGIVVISWLTVPPPWEQILYWTLVPLCFVGFLGIHMSFAPGEFACEGCGRRPKGGQDLCVKCGHQYHRT